MSTQQISILKQGKVRIENGQISQYRDRKSCTMLHNTYLTPLDKHFRT